MSLAIDIQHKLAAATSVVEQMKTRTRSWAKKSEAKDRPKIEQRAAEIITLENALLTAQKDYTPIIVSETEADAYRRGFEAAQRKYQPSRHGIIDRRVVSFDNFGSPYNAANEAKRKVHNARQTAKWADHF